MINKFKDAMDFDQSIFFNYFTYFQSKDIILLKVYSINLSGFTSSYNIYDKKKRFDNTLIGLESGKLIGL